MPLRYRQRILDHLSQDSYRPMKQRDLFKDMRIDPDDHEFFNEAIEDLLDSGRIVLGSTQQVQLPEAGDELQGKIKVNQRGFGFVIPDEPVREGDIFIPPSNVADAVTGDTVIIKLEKRHGARDGGRRSRVGRVIRVVERGFAHYVGTLQKKGTQWLVEPDGTSMRDPIVIRDPHAKNATPGDKVVIDIVEYPENNRWAEGVITEVLGEAGKPSVETAAVITAHGLRDEFPKNAIDEARDIARTYQSEQDQIESGDISDLNREDLRESFIITIDPPDAKDFDDAISIEYDSEAGEWKLGVHIADVAHFVKKGGALDKEAYERGNSTYLPRLVLPMLPEVLSNGVCSLQEGVPRLTKTTFITYNNKGKPIAQRLCRSVIISNKRLTYLEAQALIDGDEKEARKHARTEVNYSEQLIDALRMMNKLARILRKRRRKDGMIVLNLPEVELVFDDEGHVIDVVPEDDAYTHTVIEMFMVESNEAVARTFDDLNIPIIRRIHPDPSVGKMDMLQTYSSVAGIRIPDNPTRKDLQGLLEKTAESPAARAIHFAILRTLSKATYSPAVIGHYALASEHYTHFTSPIRRYPDLSIHRAVEAYLDMTDNGIDVPGGKKRKPFAKKLMGDSRMLTEDELIQLGRHCSDTEDQSTDAERELRQYLVLQFLEEHHMGGEFTGVITGASNAGVFVSIEQFLVEGLVRQEDLPELKKKSDKWKFDDRTRRFFASESGLTLGMGDEVQIQIAAIDLALRQMDLIITKMPKRKAKQDSKGSKSRNSSKGGKKDKKGKRKGYGKGRRGRRG